MPPRPFGPPPQASWEEDRHLWEDTSDQAARDAERGRDFDVTRQFIDPEPACIAELCFLDVDFARFMVGREPEHELARKWPRLAADVRDVLHLDANFLENLTLDGLLDRLARFHKSCDQAVEVGPEGAAPREQDLRSFADERDHSRRQARIEHRTARR